MSGFSCPNYPLVGLGVGIGLFAWFDVHWFLRLIVTRLSALFRKPINLHNKEEGIIYSICTTTDIDYLFHMNNARYLRELDFGRFDFYFRSGLASYLRRHPEIVVVQHAAMIRYRRSIDFLMPYRIHTRLIWYDHRSLYFEQRFVSIKDGFVRAIALCKNTCVNCDVKKMFEDVFGFPEPQECPEVVKAFMEADAQSSSDLRREAGALGGPMSKVTTYASFQ